MEKLKKAIWVIFIILFFCGFTPPLPGNLCWAASGSQNVPLTFSSDWQEIPAYGPELEMLAEGQKTASAENTTDNNVVANESSSNGASTGALGGLIDGELTTEKLDSAAKEAAKSLSNMDNQDKANMMGAALNRDLTSFGAMGKLVTGGNPSATELSGGRLGDYSLKSIQEAFLVQGYGALAVNGYFFADKLGLISLDEENPKSNEASASPENSSGSLAGGSGNLLGGLTGNSSTGGLGNLLGALTGGMGNLLGGLTGGNSSNLFSTATIPNNTTATANSSSNTKTTPKVSTSTSKNTSSSKVVAANSTKNTTPPSSSSTAAAKTSGTSNAVTKMSGGFNLLGLPLGGLTGGTGGSGNMLAGILGGTPIDANSQIEPDTPTITLSPIYGGQTLALTTEEAKTWQSVGIGWSDTPGTGLGTKMTADFDPCKPGLETKYNMFSPLVIDTDHTGAIALDGGTIQFDIAPHIAGLETIPVPAPGKDMFLVWDKAGTETIEGAAREYKDGEIIDITELFGPTDYTRSDFSVLAYTDDGFTKLRKLCDVDNDGDVDKQDTALSAEVSAKLKLWSPLSGQLILFKDTDIVIDVRAGSYERHPSDVEGWAVEYKMKDNQDNLVGYQWLTSKTSSLLCVDVLLAIQ